MIAAHLPALQVVGPLLAAPLCLLARRGGLAWMLALLTSWATFAIAVALLLQVTAGGPISYALGGWLAPWGIEYRLDVVNGFVLVIVSAIAALVMLFARQSVAREIAADRQHLFYAAFVLVLTGLLGMTITGDAFNVFVFLEISSLASYTVISLGRDRRALMAAYRYLVMGTIGATFFLIGVGLIYMVTGTLNIADMAERIRPLHDSRPVLAAFAFISVGLGMKLALFPLHLWLPNAYAYAPSVVTALLAGTATKVGIYLLLRFVFTLFGPSFAFAGQPLAMMLMGLALVAVLATSTSAIFQDDAKRLLAYSSVAQVGYIVLGISLLSLAGMTAGMVHLFNHAITKTALFLALGAVFYRLGSARLEDMAGIGRQMPLTMFAFVIAGFSLIGVPLTVGFVSKWTLISALFAKGLWPLAVLVLLGSLLAVIYIWRVVEAAYFRPRPAGAEAVSEAPLGMLLPLWLLVAASVYFGLDTSLTLGAAERAAGLLLGALG